MWIKALAFGLLYALAFALTPSLVMAQAEPEPGDPCTKGAGAFMRAAGPEIPGSGHFLVCDGTNWISILDYEDGGRTLFQVDYDSALCFSSKQGRLRYVSAGDNWDYCDGTSWTAFGGGGGTPAGANTQIQFNNSGAFGASANFNYAGGGLNLLDGTLWVRQSAPVDGTWYRDMSLGKFAGSSSETVNIYTRDSSGTGHVKSDIERWSGTWYWTRDSGDGEQTAAVLHSDDANAYFDIYDLTTETVNIRLNAETGNPSYINSGKVGIGLTSPDDLLHVAGGQFRIDNDTNTTNKGCIRYDGTGNKIQFSHDCTAYTDMGSGGGTPAGANTQIQFNNSGAFGASSNLTWDGTKLVITGDLHYSGIAYDTSDIRLKTDIRPLEGSLAKLTSLKPIAFRMKGAPEGVIEYGFSAQDIARVFPALVFTDDDAMGTMSLNYIGLMAPMVEAMKQQQTEIETLRARLNRIEASLATDRPVSQHRE